MPYAISTGIDTTSLTLVGLASGMTVEQNVQVGGNSGHGIIRVDQEGVGGSFLHVNGNMTVGNVGGGERIYAFPDLFADFDAAGDKDLGDVAAFQNCFGLSGKGLAAPCDRADWESNAVLDDVDVRELASRVTGPL